jgi:hypothetical protein
MGENAFSDEFYEGQIASLRSRLEAAEERKRKDFWAIRRLEGWLGEARASLEAAEAELTETRAALEAYRLERREGRA